MKRLHLLSLLTVLITSAATAKEVVTEEPDTDSYRYVTHYRIEIHAPAAIVWEHLMDLDSWMYEFDLSHVSGPTGQAGEVLRLYSSEDFFIQIEMLVAEKLLVIANLPSTFQDEYSTGTAVISLYPAGSQTIVDLTMSRRYTWLGEGENPLKAHRQSNQFNAQTRSMWQDRFLQRLRENSENTTREGS